MTRKPYPVRRKYNFDTEQIKEIISHYESVQNAYVTSEVFNVGVFNIYKLLKENNIQIKKGYKKYTLDEHFFDEIDTEEKAYWLGFHAADGNINKQLGTFKIKLARKDEKHLYKLRNSIKTNQPIQQETQTLKGGDKVYQLSRILINSVHLCRKLNDLGYGPNKSKNLVFPRYLNNELMRHFIRGYFDGDGGICSYCTNKISKTMSYSCCFASFERFNRQLQDYLETTINIKCSIRIQNISNNFSNLLIKNHKDVLLFLDWIYRDSIVYLDRKYKKYMEVKEYIEEMSQFGKDYHARGRYMRRKILI